MKLVQKSLGSWQEINTKAENNKEMHIKKSLFKTGETRVWRTYSGGAAVECMNLVIGADRKKGLVL